MAKISTMTHIDSIRGKYAKSDEVYTKVRLIDNQVIGVRLKHPVDNNPPTAAQQQAQDKFTTTVTAVNTALADAEQKAAYKAEWKKQKKYKTLRGFVFHKLSTKNGE